LIAKIGSEIIFETSNACCGRTKWAFKMFDRDRRIWIEAARRGLGARMWDSWHLEKSRELVSWELS